MTKSHFLRNNYCINFDQSSVLIFLLMIVLCTCIYADTLEVPGEYSTITDAITAAVSGDIISIAAGTYDEELMVNKDLTFQGAGWDLTKIKTSSSDTLLMEVNTATVVLEDLQFYSTYYAPDYCRKGIEADNTSLTIRNCKFICFGNYSIIISHGYLDVDNIVITDEPVTFHSDVGIKAVDTTCVIRNLTGGSHIDHIIDLLGSSQAIIENNILNGSDTINANGIRLQDNSTAIIRNNVINGQHDSSYPREYTSGGICLGEEGFAEIYNNEIHGFASGLYFYNNGTAMVYNNIITQNAREGITTNVAVSFTGYSPDLGGGIYGSPGNNEIHDNGLYNIYHRNGKKVYALNNNWNTTDMVAIDNSIYDDDEDPSLGEIIFSATQIGSITIIQPNGGENWQVNSLQDIKWTSTGTVENVKIEYSTNNGSSWLTIVSSTSNDGNYSWRIPNTPSAQCLVRISESGVTPSDTSDSVFSIISLPTPTITVTSPNGGESWEVGLIKNITWTSTGTVGNVKIECSINNGSSWSTIVSSTSNDGSYAWTIPNTPSTQCKIKIKETDGSPLDVSNSTFTIFQINTPISLNEALDNDELTFTTGGDSDWYGQPSVYYYGGSSGQSGDIYDDEDSYLQTTISGPGILTFYWKVSSENGYDFLNFYIDEELQNRICGELDWYPKTYNISSGNHTLKWIYEKDESLSSGTDCGWVDKVSFTGSVTPTITIIKPNGTQTWPVGSTKEIKWTTTGSVGNLRVEYSINGGSSWILIDNSTTNDGSRSWIIPNTPSLSCLVKLTSVDNPSISDTSDHPFVIYDPSVPASITVISPNGGESWGVGTTQMITWTTSGLADHVKIEYSTNGGINWAPVENHTHNDGIRPWVIPDEPSSSCKIKVSSYIDSKIFDVSDSNFTIKSEGVPELLIDKKELYFGGSTTGLVTPSQKVFINKQGSGTVAWEASGSESWLSCSPTSGTDSGELTISVNTTGLSAGNYTDVVVLEAPFTANSEQNIAIYLTVYQHGQTSAPIGTFATPIHNSTVMSSIPVTGWALDDIGIESIKIYRGNSGSLEYIGGAIFVEGARPDIEQAYPDYPLNYKAGWGYMMLTNFLPNGGNGTYTLYAKATDIEGHEVTLGSKTIFVDNANAVKPFGAIDTPRQGGIASGSSFRNHGWALTPMPNFIPTDGSTIHVYVDGMELGHPTYNIYRSDVAALFPGYANKDGAGGYFDIDTTAYTNGIHTIYWTAQDNAGNIDGIGSRYFTIQNTGGSRAKSASTQVVRFDLPQISELPVDFSNPIRVKQGYGKHIEPRIMTPNDKGIARVHIKELERIEIQLADMESEVTGYVVAGETLRLLPIGSSIKNGVFYWTPVPGFIGDYRLVFVVKDQNGDLSKREILIRIVPKFGLKK